MDHMTRSDLRLLTQAGQQPCLSMYLPTHRRGAETHQDPMRLKNLLKTADMDLKAIDVPEHQIRGITEPVRELVDDHQFWQRQSDGLALFRSPNLFLRYRLPLRFPELAVAADRFHLEPLLAWSLADSRYYILELSQRHARLFLVAHEDICELDADPLLAGIAGVTVEPGDMDRADAARGPLLQYFRIVDRGLQEILRQERLPVLLAAAGNLHPLYRQVSSTVELMEEWIPISADGRSSYDLLERAAPIAGNHFLQARRRAADHYMQLWYTKRASNTITEVLPAAHQGRVQSLFVAAGAQIWGRLNQATHETTVSGASEPAPGEQDLLNEAAIQSFCSGGAVYATAPEEVPGGGPLAAVFRY